MLHGALPMHTPTYPTQPLHVPRARRATAWLLSLAAAMAAVLITGCDNSPWPQGSDRANVVRSAMIENTPRHLDPTASYWSNDTLVTYQVYEPLYGYHYLKRPFELVPKTAEAVVRPVYLDRDGRTLPDDAPAERVAESVYNVPIKPGILYQPHPAFAKDEHGDYRYHAMKPGEVGERRSPMDFEHTGTRELVAQDFVYAIKRHATTRITTPIYGIFAEYVVGLKEYGDLIRAEDARLRAGLDPASLDKPFLDFRRWPLAGATAPDKHLLRIRIKGKYPQWKYWMQMTFLAPVPWEADAFYAQPGMAERGITLDQWPVGTGPYMLTEFIKDRRIEMVRNPNYRGEPYPCEGTDKDKAAGLLDDCGKSTPFVDRIVATVEREATPQRNKFRDGYYDLEVFERTDTGNSYVVEMNDSDDVRAEYQAKGFDFEQSADVNSYIIGFNMLDPVLGHGDTPEQAARNRKLRQAISTTSARDHYTTLFPTTAARTATRTMPPGIPGSRDGTIEGVNPVTHRVVDGRIERRPIADARRLMAEAGYPNGRDAATGRPLVLNYDYYAPPTPERKPEIDWVVRQFAKLDIQLEVRATDNNQFQDKVRKGKHQVFWLGWLADYPDAANVRLRLYGPNAQSASDRGNTATAQDAAYDRLFTQLKSLDDGPAKQAVIDEMVQILRDDAPWSFGFYPYTSVAVQSWVGNAKPAILIRDHGRYLRLDAEQRARKLAQWNQPVLWPVVLIVVLLVALVAGARHTLRKRERMNARGDVLPA